MTSTFPSSTTAFSSLVRYPHRSFSLSSNWSHYRSWARAGLYSTAGTSRDNIVITTGTEIGGLLCDGLGDGVLVECLSEELNFLRTVSFGLLQGSRMRNTKTEYVSCPSCGRTLFDLQEVTDQIRTQTGHLPGVSIAIMG